MVELKGLFASGHKQMVAVVRLHRKPRIFILRRILANDLKRGALVSAYGATRVVPQYVA